MRILYHIKKEKARKGTCFSLHTGGKFVILKAGTEGGEKVKKGSFAIKLFLYASLVSLLWLGGYVVLSGLFSSQDYMPEQPAAEVTPEVNVPIPAAMQWSVVAVINAEKDVTSFLLRYADFVADTMVFLEVPVNTKAELAAGGYEVLSVYNPELPELFMISDMCHIFSEETWCMAAEEVGLALLGVRPKECYVMEEEIYGQLTTEEAGQVRFSETLPVKEAITLATKHAVTKDTLSQELVYLESYRDLDMIQYAVLPGQSLAEEYKPEPQKIQQLVQNLQAGIFLTEDTE